MQKQKQNKNKKKTKQNKKKKKTKTKQNKKHSIMQFDQGKEIRMVQKMQNFISAEKPFDRERKRNQNMNLKKLAYFTYSKDNFTLYCWDPSL